MKEPNREVLIELGAKYLKDEGEIVALGFLLKRNELKQAQLLVFNCICQAEVDDKISLAEARKAYDKLGLTPEDVSTLVDRLEDFFKDRTRH